MAITVTVNGVNYNFPQTNEQDWGDVVTAWAVAISSGLLQKSGGAFSLTAEIDFGATYGLKSTYFKSRAANPASAGQVRLGNAEAVSWRDNANSADLDLLVNASDLLTFAGNEIADFGTVSKTEFGYLSGVTSAIQTQINAKFTDPLTTNGDIIVRAGGSTTRLAKGADGLVLTMVSGAVAWSSVAGTGDVVGPGSATDNAIARMDGTSGKAIQNSPTGMADGGAIDHARTATAISAASAGESYIGVTDTSAARTITLSDVDKVAGRVIMVKDESGGASANAITVQAQTGTIDGQASKGINSDYGSLAFISDGSTWFTLLGEGMINYSNYHVDASVWPTALSATESANWSVGSPTLTGMADTSDIEVGMVCNTQSTHFPLHSYVVSKTSSTVTMSENALDSGGPLAFGFKEFLLNESIKSGAGRIHSVTLTVSNQNNTLYARFYDKNSTVEMDTDVPILTLQVKEDADGPSSSLVWSIKDGLAFTNGLRVVFGANASEAMSINSAGMDTGILDVFYT